VDGLSMANNAPTSLVITPLTLMLPKPLHIASPWFSKVRPEITISPGLSKLSVAPGAMMV